jgi:hypothetical protein
MALFIICQRTLQLIDDNSASLSFDGNNLLRADAFSQGLAGARLFLFLLLCHFAL